MVVDKNRTDDHRFILNGEELEEVNSFVYLGSLINTEVSCMPEVNRRLHGQKHNRKHDNNLEKPSSLQEP